MARVRLEVSALGAASRGGLPLLLHTVWNAATHQHVLLARIGGRQWGRNRRARAHKGKGHFIDSNAGGGDAAESGGGGQPKQATHVCGCERQKAADSPKGKGLETGFTADQGQAFATGEGKSGAAAGRADRRGASASGNAVGE